MNLDNFNYVKNTKKGIIVLEFYNAGNRSFWQNQQASFLHAKD